MKSGLEEYLARLELELKQRGLVDVRILEEARGHLADATEKGVQRGLSLEAAEREAIARFGDPNVVAMKFASEGYRIRGRLMFAAAVALGLAIAFLDSRPGWDDAGVTAFVLRLFAGVLGAIVPYRPWVWALAIGVWIPLRAFVLEPSLSSLAMLMVLAFPFAGAYAGMAIRRALVMGPYTSATGRPTTGTSTLASMSS
jgi:hypothetical protein